MAADISSLHCLEKAAWMIIHPHNSVTAPVWSGLIPWGCSYCLVCSAAELPCTEQPIACEVITPSHQWKTLSSGNLPRPQTFKSFLLLLFSSGLYGIWKFSLLTVHLFSLLGHLPFRKFSCQLRFCWVQGSSLLSLPSVCKTQWIAFTLLSVRSIPKLRIIESS